MLDDISLRITQNGRRLCFLPPLQGTRRTPGGGGATGAVSGSGACNNGGLRRVYRTATCPAKIALLSLTPVAKLAGDAATSRPAAQRSVATAVTLVLSANLKSSSPCYGLWISLTCMAF